MSTNDHSLDVLKLEYSECNAAYNSRDGLTQAGFVQLVQNFNIFLVILLGLNSLMKTDPTLRWAILLIVGIAGFLSLFAQIVDLESNVTCKIALRKRAKDVEDRIIQSLGSKADKSFKEVQLWHKIESREKTWVERIAKGDRKREDRKERETNLYINSSRWLLFIWIVIVGISIFAGQLFEIR